MCGHDWCSMRISKEIQLFASGKDEEFQPVKRAVKSPGVSQAGSDLITLRKKGEPLACHSTQTSDPSTAKEVQKEVFNPQN